MALTGEVFAERPPIAPSKKHKKQADSSGVACTEFGALPREMIIRFGLRHVYTMPVVLEDKSVKQVFIYQAEVFEGKKWRTVYVQESADGADEGWRKLPWFMSPLLWFCSLLGFVLIWSIVSKMLFWSRQ